MEEMQNPSIFTVKNLKIVTKNWIILMLNWTEFWISIYGIQISTKLSEYQKFWVLRDYFSWNHFGLSSFPSFICVNYHFSKNSSHEDQTRVQVFCLTEFRYFTYGWKCISKWGFNWNSNNFLQTINHWKGLEKACLIHWLHFHSVIQLLDKFPANSFELCIF